MVRLDPDPPTTVPTTLAPGQVTFSRTMIDHGVPMGMAVLAITLAIIAGILIGYLWGRRGSTVYLGGVDSRPRWRDEITDTPPAPPPPLR